jgi:hypothetical protein
MRPEKVAEHVAATLRGLLDPLAHRVTSLETARDRITALERTIGALTHRLEQVEGRTRELQSDTLESTR